MKICRKGLLIFIAVLASVCCGCANTKENAEHTESVTDTNLSAESGTDYSVEASEEPSPKKEKDVISYLDEKEVYQTIIKELTDKYGELRTGPWLREIEDPERISRELNGICYLRLLDFDHDGDSELYAVCKNEEESDYTGRIYSADRGREPLFEAPVNSELGYHMHSIELVNKGNDQYYVFVRYIPDGLGVPNINRLYGYDPDSPNEFSYERFSSFEEAGSGETEYSICEDKSGGEWISVSEEEYRKSEDIWWADAEIETSLCVRSSSGNTDLELLQKSVRETLQGLTGVMEEMEDDRAEKKEDIVKISEETSTASANQHDDAGSELERIRAFYGIWCGASKDEADAESMAESIRGKGFSAKVVVTTDWSNLNNPNFLKV